MPSVSLRPIELSFARLYFWAVTTHEPNTRVVAVVDDDESIQSSLPKALQSVGLSAMSFVSAEEFLISGRLDEIGCLITDLRLSGMSGLELQARLAQDGRLIPIVFITAHGDARERARAMKAGAVAFLDKPFDDNFLLELVCRIINPNSQR
jgi:FixJ family two-component response regulator